MAVSISNMYEDQNRTMRNAIIVKSDGTQDSFVLLFDLGLFFCFFRFRLVSLKFSDKQLS